MIKKVFFTLTIFFVLTNLSIAQDDFYIKLDRKNRVREAGTLVNGEKEGLWFSFKRNGKHKKKYYVNGKKQKLDEVAIEKRYDIEKEENSFGILTNGKKEGLWFSINSNDLISSIQYYKAGILEGKFYRFHADGEVLGIDMYVNGKKDGICKEFHSGRALHYSTEYKNGKIVDGENIYYHLNGNKKFVDNYKNGLKFGKSTSYYESGGIEIEGTYRDKGLAEGPWKEYFESGKLKEEYYYKHGLFHGEYTIYDEKGTITAQYIYKNDKLIKTIVD